MTNWRNLWLFSGRVRTALLCSLADGPTNFLRGRMRISYMRIVPTLGVSLCSVAAHGTFAHSRSLGAQVAFAVSACAARACCIRMQDDTVRRSQSMRPKRGTRATGRGGLAKDCRSTVEWVGRVGRANTRGLTQPACASRTATRPIPTRGTSTSPRRRPPGCMS